ncbi:peptide chain release factor PrfB3, chloroplastic [Oryza glaberrima]|uniref:Peptide chain release factor domain-containing protein n=1 Tax=Oryza glaberrima TaxID=4538 RepID=I1PV30_ORYGL|nr:peptide chain release factor PrfB3, chloroplastic [Oryza glaberrima]
MAPTAPSPASVRAAASPRCCSRSRPRSSAGRVAALPADGRGDGASTAASYKELGLYSLKKRIEDAVVRVETTASSALEMEEARRIRQEEVLRGRNLWDNPAKSHETLSALADAIRVVDHLKDLRYKAEEAKLISQLSEMDVINVELFKQAYKTSVDATEFLDRYQMYKLLKGPYDKEGACIIVTAGSEGAASELWAERIFCMYSSWARKQGCKDGLVEKITSTSGRVWTAAIEIESEYMFGTLTGEKGTHRMIYPSVDNAGTYEATSARVDIIPLFLDRPVNLHLDENDLEISPSPSDHKRRDHRNSAVRVQHIRTGVTAESSGERSYFANKMKAISRLKAKLLVISRELRSSNLKTIKRQTVEELYSRETRRYKFGPQKLVHDLNTGLQLSELNSVLDGDIDPFIRGRIVSRLG